MAESQRGQWGSRLGFILAASGSAIGLGNIVFFPANAYKFGGGAFYLPYFIALFVIGIPVMILEFGLGHHTRSGFPAALRRIAGSRGEFVGWWAIMNASFITMYYIAILGWVLGMLVGSLGSLWQDSVAVPAFGMAQGDLPNPYAFFFHMLSSWSSILLVVIVWGLNMLIVRRGVESIERTVRISVPLMWLFMIVLIVRGLTLPEGVNGLYLLFQPNFDVMLHSEVWRGAFAQIFFTLSLGFGIMTAYASYLPRESDQVSNATTTSLLNCGFEYIAGLAIFSILFTFAMVPKASTLSMMFFIVPQGIRQMPGGEPAVVLFGLMFFLLLLLAGLTSSVSLVEALITAVIDKFRGGRGRTITVFGIIGCLGSVVFSLPMVVNRGLEDDGTLGLTILDLVDHWSFSHGLLMVGVAECLLAGWVLGARRIRESINRHTRINLHPAWDWAIKVVIPGALLVVLGMSFWNEATNGVYGSTYGAHYTAGWPWLRLLPKLALIGWFVLSTVAAWVMTSRPGRWEEEA